MRALHIWVVNSHSIGAGRVGFEPTICGSAGRRLGPGSTTGPEKSDRFLSL